MLTDATQTIVVDGVTLAITVLVVQLELTVPSEVAASISGVRVTVKLETTIEFKF